MVRLFGPAAGGKFSGQLVVGFPQSFGVVAHLIFGRPQEKQGLRGRLPIGVTGDDLLEEGAGLGKLVSIQGPLAFGRHQGGDQVFRGEKPYAPVVLSPLRGQHQQGGSPAHRKPLHHGGVGGFDLYRDKVQGNKLGHLLVGVRNRTHLLAAQSLGVKKIQENRLIDLACDFLTLGQIVQPADLQCHLCLLLQGRPAPWGRPGILPGAVRDSSAMAGNGLGPIRPKGDIT